MDLLTSSPSAVSNSSASVRAARSVRTWIRGGEWAAGERLPTEMDLVARLGVSRGTVRTVLRQLTTEGLVEELPGRGRKSKGRVVSIAPKSASRSLIGRTVVLVTHAIGEISDDPTLYTAGSAELAVDSGVTQALHRSNLHVLSINAGAFGKAEIDEIIEGDPYGVVIGTSSARIPQVQTLLNHLISRKVPLVTTGHDAESVYCDRAISDHEVGAYLLSKWLIDRGCRRIVQMRSWFGVETGWLKARTIGYQRAMIEAGLECFPAVNATNIETDVQPVVAAALQKRQLRPESKAVFELRVQQIAGFVAKQVLGPSPVDAIMAANDWDASIILAACRLLGVEPNKKVLVVGYDNWWDTERRDWEPAVPVATIDKRNAEVGREAVRLLAERVAGRLPAQPQVWRVEPKLVDLTSVVASVD